MVRPRGALPRQRAVGAVRGGAAPRRASRSASAATGRSWTGPRCASALAELQKNAAAAPGRDFAEHLTDLVVDATEASDDERAHREAIVGLGHEYLAVATGRGTVAEFLEFLRTALRGQDDGGVADDAVELLTFHRAKGLEWDTVFVTGLERGLVPISHAEGDAEALDEERRLLYVALSRAERALHVSWASERDRGGAACVGAHREPVPRRVRTRALGRGARGDRTGHEPARRARRAASGSRPRPTPSSRPTTGACSTTLVAWRLDVSRAAAVPAFVVFDNKVLRSVARRAPDERRRAARRAGVGPAKLERYGAAVLEIVGRHAASSTA